MRFASSLFIFSLLLGGQVQKAMASIKLSPQIAVDRALQNGDAAKMTDWTAQRSYLPVYTALGTFDFQLAVTPSYEYNATPNINGLGNLIDRTSMITSTLSKKFASGSTFSAFYTSLVQNSTLSSFTSSLRAPTEAEDQVGVSLRQNILRNPFGLADRLTLQAAQIGLESSIESRKESLENVALDVLTSFWACYVAHRQLEDSMEDRKRYETLTETIRRRAGLGLTLPGEQPRLRAENNQAAAKVKTAASAYLNALDTLLTKMKMQTNEDIDWDIPQELPPVPKLETKDPMTLRPMKIAAMQVDAAERNLRALQNQQLPQLDVVLKAQNTGLDTTSDASRAAVFSGNKPDYYVGVEFLTPLDSNLLRGQLADARVLKSMSETQLSQAADQTRDLMKSAERDVQAKFAYALQTLETVKNRELVVREIESAYRQGRQPLVEVIRAYNDLFATRLDQAQSIGDYNIALNQLAAARDELFVDKKSKGEK